ncbi:MAG: GSCFA domain-containing protein, partial [Eudoraea sp.]
DYIWEKFKSVWISEKADQIMKVVQEIQKGLAHRPFNEKAEQHQLFLKSLNEKILVVKKEYPVLNFDI